MKIFLFFMTFLMVACASGSKINEKQIQKGQCYVRWNNNDYKKIYQEGKGLSKEERSAQNKTFPMWQNEGIYVVEELDQNHFGVLFDPSDKTKEIYIEKMKNFLVKMEPSMESYLNTARFKFKEDELVSILKTYELVNCKEYQNSQSF